MCWFLYGAVNQGVNEKDYQQARVDRRFRFPVGAAMKVIQGIQKDSPVYRISHIPARQCDCDTAVGKHDEKAEEIGELAEYIEALRGVRGIKCVWLAKKWTNHTIASQQTVHIGTMPLRRLLADFEENCLYRIDLY